MVIIGFLVGLLLVYFLIEHFFCCLRRKKIKIRILINGTRGKSSITRLVAAALRKAGIRTIAKVSGTEPRIIYPDGEEKRIFRRGHPSIIEQVKFIREAARYKAEAMVMEVMALMPKYQWITEHRMFKSTLGVITNIRADHLDIMGPTLNNVAEAISGTIPKNSFLVSSEGSLKDFLKQKAIALGTKTAFVSGDTVTDAMMKPFGYLEHRDNVACALAVCRELNIKEKEALSGMYEAKPDPGVLRAFYLRVKDKRFEFINAFSANDPVSTFQIWRRVEKKFVPEQTKIVLINGRKDRIMRSMQLCEFAVSDLPIDYLILTGAGTSQMEHRAIQRGFEPAKIANMSRKKPSDIFERVLESIPSHGVLFAAGSIGGGGMDIVEYFEEKKDG